MEPSDSGPYNMTFEVDEMWAAKMWIRSLEQRRFGPADDRVIARIDSINDLAHLDRIFDRVFEASNWQEVVDTP